MAACGLRDTKTIDTNPIGRLIESASQMKNYINTTYA
jgi:hypothetical protein